MAAPYKNPTCRGSIMLGSACRRCERCADELAKIQAALAAPPPGAVGCICPPTSEQTCMSPMCPRKPLDMTPRASVPSPLSVRPMTAGEPEKWS